jgi:geranylgeranyl diphosphate/geranylgeranyl-bacteriochlorophyllide a reductase
MLELPFSQLASSYDVVIVGAGPAGCFAAKTLSDDHKTLVIDRNVFPRSKPCGGMLVPESMDVLKQFHPPETIFTHPKKLSLSYLDWDNNLESSTSRGFFNVSRERFDYWVFQMMRDSPARHITETKLIDVVSKKGGVELTIKQDAKRTIKAKYLIAADGHDSFIRQKIAKNGVTKYLAIQEAVEKNPDNYATFIYDNSITDFYSWIIPKRSFTLVGSAIPLGSYSRFELFKRKLFDKLGFSTTGRVEAAMILRPKGLDEVCLGEGNVLIAGEAAGLISPSTGEGISYAVKSGLNAAIAINNNSSDALGEYKKLCAPLMDEISKKNVKASILSSPEKRKQFWSKLSIEK